jgi:hypothetical protein
MKRRYKISEDRILQISNDISENMVSRATTKAELIEVVLYFRDAYDELWKEKVEKTRFLKLDTIIKKMDKMIKQNERR